MTFSLLAYDPVARQLGVASQSHYPGVGAVVTWAEAGAGAIATQAFADPTYGARGVALLRDGIAAREALERLVADDGAPELRQVGIVDAAGTIATHTGRRCVPAVGETHRAHAVALGNTLDSEAVTTAIAHGFQHADGDLAHRLLAGLRAGEAAGGDIRGRQSAALRVVRAQPTDTPWAGVVRDLRVDDHADPVGELGRLADLHDVFDVVSEAVFDPHGVVVGNRDAHDLRTFTAAGERLAHADQALGANPEAAFWAAVVHARAGHVDLARQLLDSAANRNPRLLSLFDRLIDAGILTDTDVTTVTRAARARK